MPHNETQAVTRDRPPRKIRVLVIDDHPLLREGLRIRIQSQVDMQVAGEAKNAREALGLLDASPPDVAIIDLGLAADSGLSLIEAFRARAPAVEIVVFSASTDMAHVKQSLELGARGFVCKQEDSSDILSAVRSVASGKPFLGRETSRRYRRYRSSRLDSADEIAGLSKREREIFELIAAGMSTARIAKELNLSPHTIGSHKENMRHKLGAANSAELMKRAIEWNLAKN